MHICIDCRFINASGVGRYIRNTVKRIINSSNINCILIMYEEDVNNFPEFKRRNVRVILAKSKMYSISEQLEIPIKVPKVDIFWSPHYNVPILPIKAKRRIVTIHDVNHLVFMKDLSLMQKLYAKMEMFFSTRLSNCVITVSDFSKQEIYKYTKINIEKIRVTHIGVDKNEFKKSDYSDNKINSTLSKYNLPSEYILYVGNVKPHKNIIGMIKAYSKIDSFLRKKSKLVIVGNKDKFINGIENLDEIIKKFNIDEDIIFTGFVEDKDLSLLYSQAKLFVFPSLYEGFGLPPLEAMACGCPTIVSNISSLPEICGDASYYVDPYDYDNITNAMIKVLTNDSIRKELVEKGFLRVKRFEWEKTTKKTLQIFEEILKY